MKKLKGFRINVALAREFETLCRLLGRRESDIVEMLIRDWVNKTRGQITLDQFQEKAREGITINIKQTQLNLFLVKLAQLDPKKSLEYIRGIDPEYLDEYRRTTVLETLSNILKEASALYEMAQVLQRESETSILETLIQEASLKLRQLLTNS